MPGVILISGLAERVYQKPGYALIGVDHGALICAREQAVMVAAVGDFDSVDANALELIHQYAQIVERLPAHKDETDTEEAICYAMDHGYDDILIYGALGGRLDHELANLYLMMHRAYPITLINENNRIRVITEGSYRIKKEYTFLSFLPLETSCITETGVAYPLHERVLKLTDIYAVSNEILHNEAEITVHYGRLLMMETKD